MSYRRIGSCIHNGSHSFLSLMNYVDNEFTVDEIYNLLGKYPETVASFDPVRRMVEPEQLRTPRILKALEYWCDAWPSHCVSEGVKEGRSRRAGYGSSTARAASSTPQRPSMNEGRATPCV